MLSLKMSDYVPSGKPSMVLVRCYAMGWVAVERIAGRAPISHFRPHFELRRKPMLPTNAEFIIIGLHAGPLTLRVGIELGPERKVIEWIWRVIEVGQNSSCACTAPQITCALALRQVWGIEGNKLRRERGASRLDDCLGLRVVFIRHAIL